MAFPISEDLEVIRSALTQLSDGTYQLESWVLDRWNDLIQAGNRTQFYIEYSELMGSSRVLQTAASISSFSGALGYWGFVGNALAAVFLKEAYPEDGVVYFSDQIAMDQLALIKSKVKSGGSGITTAEENLASAEGTWERITGSSDNFPFTLFYETLALAAGNPNLLSDPIEFMTVMVDKLKAAYNNGVATTGTMFFWMTLVSTYDSYADYDKTLAWYVNQIGSGDPTYHIYEEYGFTYVIDDHGKVVFAVDGLNDLVTGIATAPNPAGATIDFLFNLFFDPDVTDQATETVWISMGQVLDPDGAYASLNFREIVYGAVGGDDQSDSGNVFFGADEGNFGDSALNVQLVTGVRVNPFSGEHTWYD